MIEIYTDGSAKNNGTENNVRRLGCSSINPKWGSAIGFRIDHIMSNQEINTTNNRMELSAILYALDLTQTKYKQEKCIIKSDSAYCVNMFNTWIYNWNQNNWTRPKNQPIENLDLVKQIWEYCKLEWPNFTIEKVPGHSGLIGNELADALANNDKIRINNLQRKIEGDVYNGINLQSNK